MRQAAEGLKSHGLLRFTNFADPDEDYQRHMLLDSFVDNLRRRNIYEKQMALQRQEMDESYDAMKSVETRNMNPSHMTQIMDDQTPSPQHMIETTVTQ